MRKNTLQIVGVKGSSFCENVNRNRNIFDAFQRETDDHWTDLDTDLYHWTKPLRPVQVFLYMFPIVIVASLQNFLGC